VVDLIMTCDEHNDILVGTCGPVLYARTDWVNSLLLQVFMGYNSQAWHLVVRGLDGWVAVAGGWLAASGVMRH